LFFRKFFWDFIGGTVHKPGGIQPSPNVDLFITLIVRAPVIQIFAMIVGLIIIALEYPLPFIKGRAIHRSIILRIVMLVFQTSLCILFYQGTNAAIWSLIAAGCYTRAQVLGEVMEEAMANKGKVERA